MSQPWTGTSAVKLALAIKRQREENAEATLPFSEPIAVVGIGCRFPGGADTPEKYWQLLLDKTDAVREIPSERWNANEWFDTDPMATGRTNTRWGSFLDNVDQFDPAFFGITPREAAFMDPQQRLLLEVAWDAIWDAGVAPHSLAGSTTGVFVSNYLVDYSRLLMTEPSEIGPHSLSGGSSSIASGRISYLLDLRGPSVTIDIACSSALGVVHMACQSLRAGECSVALAGGVALHLTPGHFVSLAKLGMLSPDGKCHTFDAGANGFVPGEGCGVVVLKRLSDAIAQGDRIHAVVRGTAMMQDGRSTVLTAPNGPAQEAVVQAALANARIAPEQVTFVETHGTGTALGDPIEVEALIASLPGETLCALGAVKTNFGHMEAAAGIAGFIKAVLSLEHEAIPANLHFKSLNPHVSLDGTRFVIPTETRPWPRSAAGRFAGVSSFGFSGTNTHVILEEAPKLPARATDTSLGTLVLPVSARSAESLTTLAQQYETLLRAGAPAGDVCRAAALRRSHYEERLAVTGHNADELAAGIHDVLQGRTRLGATRGRSDAPSIVFVCSGQGSQWPGMGRELMQHAAFRTTIEACDASVRQHAGWSLIEVLEADEATSRLQHTEYAQPAIVAVEIAIARLWESWGIIPIAVIGHSVGEIAAAHLAGALELDEAMRVVLHRGRLMERATGTGRMAAVYLTADEVRKEIASYGDRVSLAAVNAPGSTVVSGETAAINALMEAWKTRGIEARMLPVDYAFHSAQMEPFRTELVTALGRVETHSTVIPMISTVTGQVVTGPELDTAYWGRNIRQPVLFADAMQRALGMELQTFVEVGPHPSLASAMQENIAPAAKTNGTATSQKTASTSAEAVNATDAVVFASVRRNQDAESTMLAALGGLYTRGASVRWEGVYTKSAPVLSLPSYPYQRRRYWIPQSVSRSISGTRTSAGVSGSAQPFLGARVRSPLVTGIAYDVPVSRARFPYLTDHRIGDAVIMPMTGFLEIVVEAVRDAAHSEMVVLEDIVVRTPLTLPEDETRTVQVLLDGDSFRVFALDSDAWALHVEGRFRAGGDVTVPKAPTVGTSTVVSGRNHYIDTEERGAQFGPAFQTVVEVNIADNVVQGLVRLTLDEAENANQYWIHPALLDGCVQTALDVTDDEALLVPIAIDQFVSYGRAGAEVRSTLQVRPAGADADMLTADLWVADQSGHTICSATGLRFKPMRNDADPTARYRYCLQWSTRARGSQSTKARSGAWLILGDANGAAKTLREALERRGESCDLVAVTEGAAALERGTYRSIVHLAAIDTAEHKNIQRDATGNAQHALDAHLHAGVQSTLALIQTLARKSGDMPSLWLVTQNTEAIGANDPCDGFADAPLLGLARTIGREHPELACTTIDLDTSGDVQSLVDELLAHDGEDRIAFRGNERYVARLEMTPATASQDTPRRLTIPTRGTPDNLKAEPITLVAPAAGHIEVHVDAASLNFRDVLNVLGMYPGDPGPLGLEFVGRVGQIGDGVTDYRTGDRVMGIAWGTFATTITVPTSLIAPAPVALDVEAAATMPNAFVTAHHCLVRTAKLQRGERVLIHAGAGGVGMAAIQLALDIGAEVFTTAGSDEKREYLRSIGAHHVLDSRSLDFSRQILEITNGRGVDVVLNSLSGEFIAASFATTGKHGRFVEIGKIGIFTPAQVDALGKSITYTVVDLGVAIDEDQSLIGEQLEQIRKLTEAGRIRPLPHRTFAFDDAPAAFRYMAQARHLGRVVLRFPSGTPVHPNATYVITGGLGGIGLQLAEWFAEQSATHLVLLGRSEPSPAAQSMLNKLRTSGVTIDVRAVDVTNRDALAAMFADLARTMPPIRGIVHSAGIIDDGMLVQQQWDRFARVLAPKVQGTWLLHELTHDLPLDFFILCSSVAAIFGSSGQGAYSAGNAFLDALAAYRRAHDLPALSINWGAWADVGMAARTTGGGKKLALDAIRQLDGATYLQALERVIATPDAQTVIADVRWTAWRGSAPSLLRDLVRNESATATSEHDSNANATPSLKDELERAPVASRRSIFLTFVKQEARRVMGLADTHAIDERQPLLKMGLDSLMAVELRNRLAAALGRSLPATLLFDHPSPGALADFVLGAMAPADTTASASTATPDDDEDALLRDIADMSDEEAERLLERELGAS